MGSDGGLHLVCREGDEVVIRFPNVSRTTVVQTKFCTPGQWGLKARGLLRCAGPMSVTVFCGRKWAEETLAVEAFPGTLLTASQGDRSVRVKVEHISRGQMKLNFSAPREVRINLVKREVLDRI